MKPYGLTRKETEEFPDVGDLKKMGSSKGKLPNRNGERRSYFRKASSKSKVRRYFKRKARKQGKDIINTESYEV